MSTVFDSISQIRKQFQTAYADGGVTRKVLSIPAEKAATEDYAFERTTDRMETMASSPFAAPERDEELFPSIDQTVDAANLHVSFKNRSIRFKVNREMDDAIQVQIVDSERNKIIRSIPTDEMLQLNRRLRELSGLGAMVDESR